MTIGAIMRMAPVIPVLVIEDSSHAVPLAGAGRRRLAGSLCDAAHTCRARRDPRDEAGTRRGCRGRQQWGGLPALKTVAGPFGRVRFCPTGEITNSSAAEWLACPAVLCVGGTWLAKRGEVDWTKVERRPRAALRA